MTIPVEQAKAVIREAQRLCARFDRATYYVRELADNQELFVAFRRAAGRVMGELYVCIMRPLEQYFSDTDLRIEGQDGVYFDDRLANRVALSAEVESAAYEVRQWLTALSGDPDMSYIGDVADPANQAAETAAGLLKPWRAT